GGASALASMSGTGARAPSSGATALCSAVASATGSGAVAGTETMRTTGVASGAAATSATGSAGAGSAAGCSATTVIRPNSSTTIVKITLSRSAYEISQLSSRSSEVHSAAASVARAISSSAAAGRASFIDIDSTRSAHELRDRRRRAHAAPEDHVADIRRVPPLVEQQHGLQIDDAARELVPI